MALPSTSELLVSGGDTRIALDSVTGLSQYGSRPLPDAQLASLGSSTASLISSRGFAAADQLRRDCEAQLGTEAGQAVYARQLDQLRAELLALCGCGAFDAAIVFAASGTDLFLLAAGWIKPRHVIMIDPLETGSGLKAALQGCHFNRRTAGGADALPGTPLDGWPGSASAPTLATLAPRQANGLPRAVGDIDAECAASVDTAAGAGQRVLLVLTDASKTGMIVPSIAVALALRRRWPNQVELLVDACQFRLAPATLRAYLAQDILVALSGSKFAAGPTFSGALLAPPALATRYRDAPLCAGLRDYSNRAEWPAGWLAGASLPEHANFGLLLRWQAALAELWAFAALPPGAGAAFLDRFGLRLRTRLAQDPRFDEVKVPPLQRAALGSLVVDDWDARQSIFTFVLLDHSQPPQPIPALQLRRLHWLLQQPGDTTAPRFQLGQPVVCGESLTALRLCVSAPMMVRACLHGQEEAVISEALAALDRLVRLMDEEGL